MGRLKLLLASICDLNAQSVAAETARPARPNVVFFLVDELHGWQRQVGARFSTPNPNCDSAKPDGRFAARQPTAPKPKPGGKKKR